MISKFIITVAAVLCLACVSAIPCPMFTRMNCAGRNIVVQVGDEHFVTNICNQASDNAKYCVIHPNISGVPASSCRLIPSGLNPINATMPEQVDNPQCIMNGLRCNTNADCANATDGALTCRTVQQWNQPTQHLCQS